GVALDDLIDFTPELKAEGQKLASKYKLGPIFTPPVVSTWPGPLATLMLPNATGGANWQGGALDPETNMFYIFSNTQITPLGLVPADTSRSDFGFASGTARDPNAPAVAAGGRGSAGGGGRGAGAGSGQAASTGSGPAPAATTAGGGLVSAGGA